MAFSKSLGPITSSGTILHQLGLGCAPLGDLFSAVTEVDAQETVVAAYQSGIRFFDTAPHYGAGLSEQRLGRALEGVNRDTYTLATKVARTVVDADGKLVDSGTRGVRTIEDLSYDGVMRSIESSLIRLKSDRIDVAYLHDPSDVESALGGAFRALQDLRDEGVIRAIGVGMNFSEPLARFATVSNPDVVMVAGKYTLLDRSAAAELFPVTKMHGVQVVAAGVLNTGILASPIPGARYDYRIATDDELALARAMQAKCETFGIPLAAAAIQFPLRHDAVNAVVVGARTPAEVDAMVANASMEIPEGLWDELAG